MTKKTFKIALKYISTVYFILLTYVVVALVWWFISLEKQNAQMYNFAISQLAKDEVNYVEKLEKLENIKQRKTVQYLSEGITFLTIILVGSVFVFRATRRQMLLVEQQQNFMMAITHEFKTPIAAAQLNLETLLKRQLPEVTQRKLIANALQETARINTLTNNILISAQLESGRYKHHVEEVNYSELIKSIINDYQRRMANINIEYVIQEGVYVKGEALLLQLLINNLIDNAIKYSPREQPIIVRLSAKNNICECTVIDYGVGIPNEEKKNVFLKFYRVGNETQRKTKGTGLGLFLCKKIVKDFEGRIFIKDNLPNGSIFTVSFPTV